MNSYLQLAETVLRETNHALSAPEILEAAYRFQLVPEQLFGKTQHKTLQARLSEDLLHNCDCSVFARIAPGKFVLRSSLGTQGQSHEEFIAPLRVSQLKKYDVICADREELRSIWKDYMSYVPLMSILAAFSKQVSLAEAEKSLHHVHLRLLVSIKSRGRVLTVNSQSDPNYGNGRSFGFLGYIKSFDIDLFSRDNLGLNEASFRTLKEQAGLPREVAEQLKIAINIDSINCLRLSNSSEFQNSVVVLTSFECDQPDEIVSHIPTRRKPKWVRLPNEVNNIETLEPVSREILASENLLVSMRH